MLSKRSYSPSVPQRKIELSNVAKNFFAQRGQYDEDLPSYEKIQGKNPSKLPDEINEGLVYGVESYTVNSYPVTNKEIRYEERAEHHAKRLLAKLNGYNSTRYIEMMPREYMLSGHTKPIRLRGVVKGAVEIEAYVKKPSTERLFGLALYNLLSGFSTLHFVFNETVLIEEKVPGQIINERGLIHAIKKDSFLESIIELDILNEFMSINDLCKLDNLIISADNRLRAFDFDCLFHRDEEDKITLLKSLEGALPKPEDYDVKAMKAYNIRIEAMKDHSRRRLCKKVITNEKKFRDLVKYMKRITILNEAVKESYGLKNVEDFFERSFDNLRKNTKCAGKR